MPLKAGQLELKVVLAYNWESFLSLKKEVSHIYLLRVAMSAVVNNCSIPENIPKQSIVCL